MPAAIPLAVFGLVLWRSAPSQIVVIGRLLLFLTTPYLLSVILFPQSVSIHPYIYDHWFIIPVVVSGLMAMLSPLIGDRLRGAGWLGFLLSGGAILMSNLLGIAQGLARAIAFFKS
jgi:hypothetical protein